MTAQPEPQPLSTRLVQSSSEFAGSALGAMSEGKHPVCLLHAATALEHLAKAVLAERHPSLIAVASKDNYESLLVLAGVQPPTPAMRVRTISLREALDRAKLFAPECASLIKDLHLLIAVRDGIVHLADASAATVEEVLVVYLKATEELRAALADVVRTSYWGGFVDLVDSALRENVEQARLRVEAALAVARAEFARRFAELDEKTKTAIRSTIVASYSFASDEEQLIHCPACETEALVSGSVIADYEPDWDQHDDGRPWLVGVSVQVLFTPDGLLCNACHLELNGRDEMNAAGVGDPWYLEDIDVWINAYEPDY